MDKKAVQILNRLMDDRKKHAVSAEELAYARKMGVVVEDRPITLDQALDVLERCFESCLLYTSPSPRDGATPRMPPSA